MESSRSKKRQGQNLHLHNNIQCKRLLSKQNNPGPSNLHQSSDQSQHQTPKKTRDLPNLTECHSCGFRVDITDGKNKLQILYSEWRIVLLCKKCFRLVESAQICSYCFSEASGECFHCGQCKHFVHKECFSEYKNVAPWSYACMGSEFTVCVDCWVPKSTALERSMGRRRRRCKVEKVIADSDKGNSKVLASGDCERSLEDAVKDASSTVEKKIEAALRAREKAVKKAEIAKKAFEKATNALNLVAKGDENVVKENGDNAAIDVSGDAELALQLFRALNGSPRISKNRCVLNSICLSMSKVRGSHTKPPNKASNPSNSTLFRNLEVCGASKLYESPEILDPSACISALDHGSSMSVNCLNPSQEFDMAIGLKNGEADSDVEDQNREELLKQGGGIHLKNLTFNHKQNKGKNYEQERCGNPNRYFLKYRRRGCQLMPSLDGKTEICLDKSQLGSQAPFTGVR